FLKFFMVCFIVSVDSPGTVLCSDYHKLDLFCKFVIINFIRGLVMTDINNHYLQSLLFLFFVVQNVLTCFRFLLLPILSILLISNLESNRPNLHELRLQSLIESRDKESPRLTYQISNLVNLTLYLTS